MAKRTTAGDLRSSDIAAVDDLLSPPKPQKKPTRRAPARAVSAKPSTKPTRKQIPEGRHRTTIDMDQDLYQRLRRAAFEREIHIREILVAGAEKWLQKEGF